VEKSKRKKSVLLSTTRAASDLETGPGGEEHFSSAPCVNRTAEEAVEDKLTVAPLSSLLKVGSVGLARCRSSPRFPSHEMSRYSSFLRSSLRQAAPARQAHTNAAQVSPPPSSSKSPSILAIYPLCGRPVWLRGTVALSTTLSTFE
jgi:hypothetical protein